MLQISKQQILDRLDSLPINLHDELFNVANGKLVWDVCKTHHLSDEKTGLVLDLVSDVMYGFAHYSDLARDIRNEVGVDAQVANVIAQEIDEKLFSKFRDELKKVYNPVSLNFERTPAAETPPPKTIVLETPPAGETTASQEIPIEFEKPAPGEPLILRREEPLTEERKSPFKSFSFPGFFKSKRTEPEEKPPVKVRVETPGESGGFFGKTPPKAKEEKRVVHYSEFRTPLTPFGDNNEFINLENFSKTAPAAKTIFPAAPTQQNIPKTESGALPPNPESPPPPNETAPTEKPVTPSREPEPAKKLLWFLKNKKREEDKKPAPPPPLAEKPDEKKNIEPKLDGNLVDLRQTTNDL